MGIVTRMQGNPARITLTLVLALLFAEALTASPADAASTFTVNSTADPGTGSCDSTECSLREAITAANTNAGTDTINFNIPGSGVKTIAPISALPTITNAVNIDSGSGDTIGGTVAGARNVISANQGDGVFISGSQVQGNYVGTDASGTTDLGNSFDGVTVSGTSKPSSPTPSSPTATWA